jgi:hypothetical protein
MVHVLKSGGLLKEKLVVLNIEHLEYATALQQRKTCSIQSIFNFIHIYSLYLTSGYTGRSGGLLRQVLQEEVVVS